MSAHDALEQLALRAEAADVPPGDAPGGPGQPGAAPAPESPNVAAIGFMLSAFRQLATMLLKVESLAMTLDDKNVEQCAKALAPVADKYGINLGTMFDGPEGLAIMVAGPILWTAATQLNSELKARKAKPVEPVADDAPA
jgi:hypothetical protein